MSSTEDEGRSDVDHVDNLTPNPIDAIRDAIRHAAPGAFVDGGLDLDALRILLGDDDTDGPQRYLFAWAGKVEAARIIQTRSDAALRPVRDESVDWDETTHVFIEGENLEVLKLLYKAYFGRIRLVYIDPPYNTGEDRIYLDNYADPLEAYLELTGQADSAGKLLTSNPETAGRYHSTWLSMLFPRLMLAHQLLRDDGFIVVSIDDAELHHLRILLNETFGEENYVATLVWDRNRKNDAKFFSVGHEYMVVYARNLQYLRDSGVILRAPKEGVDEVRELWDALVAKHGENYDAIRDELRAFLDAIPNDDPRKPLARFRKVDARGPYRDDVDISWPGGGGPTYDVPHPVTGKPCKVPSRGWVYPSRKRMDEEIAKDNVAFGQDETTVPALKSYLFEKAVQVMQSVGYSYAQTAAQTFDELFDETRVFDNPKNFEDLRAIVDYLTDDEDVVLDFFAGSASSGHGVLESNRRHGARRRFLLVQLQEPVDPKATSGANALKLGLDTVADIGRERLQRVLNRLRADSVPTAENEIPEDLGFRVFRLSRSNFGRWPDGAFDESAARLFVDRLETGWDPEAVMWEIALREGMSLSSRVEALSLGSNTVYRLYDDLRDQFLFVCLDDAVGAEVAHDAGLTPDQVLVCRDAALTDEVAANLALVCRLKTV